MPNHRSTPYLEAHSALNGPLLAYGVLPLAAEAVCFTLRLAANPPWFFVLMLYLNWPTGVRVDDSGISVWKHVSPPPRALKQPVTGACGPPPRRRR